MEVLDLTMTRDVCWAASRTVLICGNDRTWSIAVSEQVEAELAKSNESKQPHDAHVTIARVMHCANRAAAWLPRCRLARAAGNARVRL